MDVSAALRVAHRFVVVLSLKMADNDTVKTKNQDMPAFRPGSRLAAAPKQIHKLTPGKKKEASTAPAPTKAKQ